MPNALTVISNISSKTGNEESQLRTLLDGIGQNPAGNLLIPFQKMETIHFASWLILPGNGAHPSRLLFETNYDGPLDKHLDELIKHGGRALDQIYSLCDGYNVGLTPGIGIKTYFQDVPSVFYAALPDRTVGDIRNAIAVYDEANGFLDSLPTRNMSKKAVDDALLAHFKRPGVVQPQKMPVTQRDLQWRLGFNLGIPAALYVLLIEILWRLTTSGFAIFVGLIPFLYIFFVLLAGRVQELMEEGQAPLPHPTSHPESFVLLNIGPQNHLCTWARLRPGWFRLYLMKQALALGTVLSKYVFILGKLDLMPTIHFARWILVGNELVFLSNYDGSFSSYLSDFSDQAWGVNLVWGNTEGYPPTRFLVGAGAKDLNAFEAQGLQHYYPAQVFYSAYYGYPVVNILRYLEFRDALARRL